jgi:hypothetical protein
MAGDREQKGAPVTTLHARWSVTAFAIGLLAILASGCVVGEGGYGYVGDVGYGLDYYEPYGVRYGGWGPGYRVAPYRGGEHRSVPSIPSGSRGGGGHGGGGHGGGGHGGGGYH